MKSAIRIALPCILVSGCEFNESAFKIANKTDVPVRHVSVSDGSKNWDMGDLKPGESVQFRGKLKGEGGPDISWTIGTRRFTDKGCYYTSGAPAKGRVLINGQKLEFKCG